MRNPPADRASIRTTLVEVLDETAVEAGTSFVWSYGSHQVRPGCGDPWIDVESGLLFDGTPFTCEDAQACATVED